MTETRIYEYTRGDTSAVDGDDPLHGELMELNVGPQHPATHGVLRLQILLDGETVARCEPDVGYQHRRKEKTCETLG
jgi:NADH:ubiquinone oxidoreductase subunit D